MKAVTAYQPTFEILVGELIVYKGHDFLEAQRAYHDHAEKSETVTWLRNGHVYLGHI